MENSDYLSSEAMNQYEYIDHVLGNYFAVSLGHSEGEAITALLGHMTASPEMANGLRKQVAAALVDQDYSWSRAFSEHDVLTIEDEADARRYAVKLFEKVTADA